MIQKEKNLEIKMPKNVRQVGKVSSNYKVFIEDYVMSFLKNLIKEENDNKLAILIGEYKNNNEEKTIFVYGCIKVKSNSLEENTNDTWKEINEEKERYFKEGEVIGVFISDAKQIAKENPFIKKVCKNNKLLIIHDTLEENKNFYIAENNKLIEQTGYFIYYIKNDSMQSYIINYKEGEREEKKAEDDIVVSIRKKIKNDKRKRYRSSYNFMFIATTAMSFVILVISATLLNNNEQIKKIENTLDKISQNINEIEKEKSIAVVNNNVHKEKDEEESEDPRLSVDISLSDVEKENEKDNKGKEAKDKEENKEEDKEKKDKNKDVKNKKEKDKKEKRYIIKKGDTLATISYNEYKSYNHVKEIKEINNIENENFIVEGQVIILP